jgi:hypothetical protein
MRVIQFVTARTFVASTAASADAQGIDWAKIDSTFGRTAAVAGEIRRYGFPRTDLQMTLDGVAFRPALALGGWIAFEPMRDAAMVMGDLVLLQSEVNPVTAKLLEGGLEVTAVRAERTPRRFSGGHISCPHLTHR